MACTSIAWPVILLRSATQPVASLSFCPFWHTTTTGLPRYSGRPVADRAAVFSQGAGSQTWIGTIVVIYPDVDDGRRMGQTDKARELGGGEEDGGA